MIFLFILLFSLIQNISSQTDYQEKCFDIDSTDSKLECRISSGFYNINESFNVTIATSLDRYFIQDDDDKNTRTLTILKLNKNDDGNGTFYAKRQSNDIISSYIYNTLIYSKPKKLFNHFKFKCINV
jgi:hypothetical protein